MAADNSSRNTLDRAKAAPIRRGGFGRAVGLLGRLTLGGTGAALLLAPPAAVAARAGAWALRPIGEGWALSEVAGVVLLSVAGLWALLALVRRPSAVADRVVNGAADRDRAAAAAAAKAVRSIPAAAPAPAAADGEDGVAAPARRVDDVDPAAVRSTWSASKPEPKSVPKDNAPATVPFPAAAVAEESVNADEDCDGEWTAESIGPDVIRFEDVPRTVAVGDRVVDLTELDGEEGGLDGSVLKGLSKRERRTVRKALRDRERLLRRAA